MCLLVFLCIVACIQIYISVSSLHQVTHMRKEKGTSVLMTISLWIFCISAIVFILCRISLVVTFCFANAEYRMLSFSFTYLSYVIHLFGLLLLLYSRLRDVFDGTVYKISNITRYSFIFIVVILLLFSVLVLLDVFDYSIGLLLLGLCTLLTLFTAQFLTWSFVYKLFKIRSSTDNETIYDDKFLIFLRKYSVLSLICVMFTTLYSIIATVSGIIGYGYEWSIMLSLILVGDVFIDSLCMLLSFKSYDNAYGKCCYLCHRYCPCLLCIQQERIIHNMQLERVKSTENTKTKTNSSDIAGTSTPSPMLRSASSE